MLLAAASVWAQAPPDASSSGQQPIYTLRADARVVLTDVVVTDADGKPVHGLARSVFHITDNKRPMELMSFEEHTGAPGAQINTGLTPAHVFSNDFLLHPPDVFNVVMLNTATINIVDQMYLNEQLTHFIENLPDGAALAIYVHAGEFTILLQNFTSDHALLLAALHKAIPLLPQPGARGFSDVDALRQISTYLGQLPGRKNVLWFAGGPSIDLVPDPTRLPRDIDFRELYDDLARSRIAMYPIDVRGVVFGQGMAHILMNDMAQSSGGKAYYNNNGLEKVAARILDNEKSFYTLTYRLPDEKQDGKWHKVKLHVDGADYTLSYRPGYYDDGSSVQSKAPTSRTLLRANGETVKLPENRSQPIIFQAMVVPDAQLPGGPMAENGPPAQEPKRGETAYTIRYSVPIAAFSQQTEDARVKLNIGAGALIFNHLGRAVGRVSQLFSLTFDPLKLQAAPNGFASFDQQVNVAQGEDYLYVAVWDAVTSRIGTLQIPLDVAKTR